MKTLNQLAKEHKVTKRELLKRIVALEKQVKELQARPYTWTFQEPPVVTVTTPLQLPSFVPIMWPPYTPYVGDFPNTGTTVTICSSDLKGALENVCIFSIDSRGSGQASGVGTGVSSTDRTQQGNLS